MTMDKPIEKKKGIALAFTAKALPYWFGGFMAIFILWLVFRDDSSILRVNGDTLTISDVTSGEFNDYIRITGQVHPMTTIQLSPRESGIVEEIVCEEGAMVKAGDIIIRLNNDDLDLEILNSESNLAEKENALRNTMIQMEQEKMQLSLNILELETEVKRKGRALESQKRLFDDGLIGKEEYLRSEEDYTLFCKKLEVTIARLNEGKPEKIVDKMVDGRIQKYYKEVCLIEQPFVKDGDKSISQLTAEVAKEIGANINIVSFERFERGEGIEKRKDNFAEEIAAQMAAMK